MTRTNHQPTIGIIGGTGLCTFPDFEVQKSVKPRTNYGYPSDEIIIGKQDGVLVAFLPRHGRRHNWPPQKVPYKANIAALKQIGVKYILATCMAGSLKKTIAPGSFVVLDQFVNLTAGRDDYFNQDDKFSHLPMANPYCAKLRDVLIRSARAVTKNVFTKGTVAVIEGPRFSTTAESKAYMRHGWDVINMTQYPECYFARELGICYAAIAAIMDYDVGVSGKLTVEPENRAAIASITALGIDRTKAVLAMAIKEHMKDLTCGCAERLVKSCDSH